MTFESVAEIFTSRVIAFLLFIANADGARGLLAKKSSGGDTIVQNPETAEVGFMPLQAVNLNAADEVLEANQLSKRILVLLNHE